jgi:uncharacterized membrane protein
VQPKAFLNALDHDRIVKAIGQAEACSRAEVRVHVTNQAVDDAHQAAAAQFAALRMTATAERNGVLIYVAPHSQKFAIIGDAGIHQACGPSFWQEVAAAMEADFRAGRFTDGIVKGLARTAEALGTHFPRREGVCDVNELKDEVTED